MKKKVVLFVFLLFIFSSITAFAATVPLDIQTKKVVENKTGLKINLSIPTVNSSDSMITSIFKKIDGDIESFGNTTVQQSKEYGIGGNFEAVNNFQVPYNDGNLLSLVSNNYFYAGGAHGMSTLVPYNYDLKTGQKLALADMFVKGFDYKSYINQQIRTEIAKDKDMYFNQGADFKGITDNQGFYFSKTGITVFFQLYEIAPYAAGFRYFEIPMQNISGKLKFELK